MKWLVTAFEPFAQWKSNSSLTVLRQLEREDWRRKIHFASPVPVRKIADNGGVLPPLGQIESGPELLWSPIPWEKFSGDCERSYSAGTYVCNTLMYHTLKWCQAHEKWGGFVHVPLLQSQDPRGVADAEVVRVCREILNFL